jgi:penicillin-binding protein 1A
MMIFLRQVTAHGTGAAAAQLNHPLGGKTGTTSDFTDAWFIGFSPSVTCGVWVGYDSRQSLGEKETGAKAALPIWMNFMRQAIAGKDDEQFLDDAADDKTLKASATALPAAVPRRALTSAVAGPATVAHPGSALRSAPATQSASPLVKPALRPAIAPNIEARPVIPPTKSQVRPALPPQ